MNPSDPSRAPGATPGANRLGRETSPYLLQHAANPVDWFAWGEDAFAEARRRGVPIFLSVGYSTCYWCHVMERECFENAPIGALMSELFVCVKVDREERPDVDDLYMTATQIMTGRGGWPMSVFLEPDTLRPFFCGTYFPPEPRGGMPSFPQVLRGMSDAWANRRNEVNEQAERLADAVAEHLAGEREPRRLGPDEITLGVTQLLRMFDATHGGFGGAPKFPQPSFTDLLLDVRAGAADEATRDAIDRAVRTTLDRMAIGGIYDHIGGGFHRYAVDQTWTVPHFEKMLYDNALLASTYARAAEIYDDAFYRRVVRQTLDYALAEMRNGAGGFHSAQDAEVDGREGLNYLWTPDTLADALAPEDAQWVAEVFGVARGPNFRDPHHPDEPARSVLRMDARPEAVAARVGVTPDAFFRRLDTLRTRLDEARARRPQPHLDDKALAAWNGLMIAGLADGGALLDEPAYLDAAERAARFVMEELWEGDASDGRLLRTWRGGRAHTPGFLEDSAFVLWGLASLARAQRDAGREEAWALDAAERVIAQAERDFAGDDGALFDTREGQGDLFVRARTTYDGATPSGVSLWILACARLHELAPEAGHDERALRALRGVSAAVAEGPVTTAVATRALYRLLTSGIDPGRFAFGPAVERAPDRAPGADPDPVQLYASIERIELAEDAPADFVLLMKIREGYHIVASNPQVEGEEDAARGLLPLRIGYAGGEGVAVYADYPRAEAFGVEGVGRIGVLTGEHEIRVAVERSGAWRGRPLLTVRYQACSETECLPARTVELDIALDPVR